MTQPWYREGLQFACSGCGYCCGGEPGYVWMTHREIDEMAEHLGLTRPEFGRKFLRRVGNKYSLLEKPGGDCILFDRGCNVYSVRPEQCRTYPFWPENLDSPEAWERAARECPGIGQGRIYPPEEVREISGGKADTSNLSRK